MDTIHLPATASVDQVASALKEHGYVIVDNLVSNGVMDQIRDELAPYIEASAFGPDNFLGLGTKRTGQLILRSPTTRDLIMNPLVLGAVADLLKQATAFQLHLTQVISVHPGSSAQPLHRDEGAWDFFPFPADYHPMCNTLWAFSDYTAEMGATRVVPGSHLNDRNDYSLDDTIASEMSRGSVLLYTGKTVHGAGANVSDKVRQALNLTYSCAWLRQEENQYLSTPLEVAKTLPEDLLRLMGYQPACFSMGYVGEYIDPIAVVRPEWARSMTITDIANKIEESDLAAKVLEKASSSV